jgi:hypothetical protein
MTMHLIGVIAWMGGTWAAFLAGRAGPGASRVTLGFVVRQEAAIYRTLVGPGAMATVLSGLFLTLQMYGGATSVGGVPRPVMLMQLTGLVGGLMALVAVLPTAMRVSRIDPAGEYAAAFDRLRSNLHRWAVASAVLGMIALITGAMGR